MFPTGGFALTASIVGQTLIVPLTATLPVLAGPRQSMVTATEVVAPAATVSSTEVLAGLVERVTFHNDENGFCVLRVKARGQRDLITVLGHAAMIAAGV